MVQIKYRFNSIVLIFLLVRTVGVSCRDLSETDRSMRANYIRKLLNKQKQLEGRIKLVGGPTLYEGNVYVFHAGRWGAVCDDSWDHQAASVVCRIHNRTGIPTVGSRYGEAFEKFWLDDVICQGDEESLSKCSFVRWGASDCNPDEVAGVICVVNDEAVNYLKVMNKGRKLQEVLNVNTASVRLNGGKNFMEGRVEIYHKGQWGSICPNGWTLYEAAVVCRHMGLGFAAQALQTYLFGFTRLFLNGIHCEGDEDNLFQCTHQEIGNVSCPGDIGHAAAVVCTDFLADLELDTSAIEFSAHLQDVMLYQLKCAMEENCLSKSAYEIQRFQPNWQFETRRLLRFTASSLNIGNAEFKPYLPKHLWQWHLCHMHYHSMEVFATFDIIDENGKRVAEGHKASFCLEDNTCLSGVEKKYSCKNYGDQGISVNCSDVYMYHIDCQWVDVTDVEPGDYRFKVAINPHIRIAEQRFDNNAASCLLRLAETYAMVTSCRLEKP